MIVENMLIAGIPSGIYAAVARRRHRLAPAEIAARLGLRVGSGRWYAAACAASLPFIAMVVAAADRTKGFQGSMVGPFAGRTPSTALLGAAFVYAFIATALPEELLFRGLIAGALFRKCPYWTANILQAAVFTAPHLLILSVAPTLWPLLPGVFVLALTAGWLRERSGSIGPGLLVHAASNLGGALAVMAWSGR